MRGYARDALSHLAARSVAGSASASAGSAQRAARTCLALAMVLGVCTAAAAVARAQRAPDAGGLAARDTSTAAAIEELLGSARLWQALNEPAVEQEVLRKILSVRADEPRALFLLTELAWRRGDRKSARASMAQLRRSVDAGAGQSERNARRIAELQRLEAAYTKDRAQLDQLRLALRGGDQVRAQALARALFPDARPPGELANEFAPVLSATPGGWEALRALFEERLAAEPNANDRMSLYALLAQREDSRPAALAGYASLAHAHDVDPGRLADAWRRALASSGDDDRAQAEQRRFLERFPGDPAIAQLLRNPPLAHGTAAESEGGLGAGVRAQADPAAPARAPAERLLDQGDLVAAKEQLEAVLRQYPRDGETLGLLGLIALRQGRHADALQGFEQAQSLEEQQPARRARWRDLARTARYWGAVQGARALREGGQYVAAITALEAVRALQPDQHEADYLLAELRAASGQVPAAEAYYRERLQADGHEARAWKGLVDLRLQQARIDEALDTAIQGAQALRGAQQSAAGAPSAPSAPSANALEAILDAGSLRAALARAAAQGASSDTLLRQRERAITLLPGAPWLRFDLAQHYRALGLPELARQVMAQGQARAPQDAQMQFAAALVLAANGQDEDALGVLAAIKPDEQGEGTRSLAQRLRFERALAAARRARAAGQTQAAIGWRDQALDAAGTDAGRRLRIAQDDYWAGDPAAALQILSSLEAPELQAGDENSRNERLLLSARAHTARGERSASYAEWEALRARLPPDELPLHLEAIDALRDEPVRAQAWMAQLRAQHPQDPDVLLAAARQARDAGRYDEAVELLRRAATSPPAPALAPRAAAEPPLLAPRAQAADTDTAPAPERSLDSRMRAGQELARVLARRQPQADTAVLTYGRKATDGISTLRGTEAALVAVWPQDFSGHWFAQLDRVALNAGTLTGDAATAGPFGRVQALQPTGLAQPWAQQAQGTAFAGGWRGDARRIDLGVVGVGFRVPNLVGGWHEAGSWGATDWGLDLSRRVLTGSLLSYAGALDPASGAVWGGVTHTALNLRAARDLSLRWSASTSLLLGRLAGRNVRENTDLQSRSVVERDWIQLPELRVSAGAVFSAWHYARNENFTSFGQGGYYSPQRYLALGLPLEAQGRSGAWSYDARASLGRSWTHEDGAPYYPTDPRLQASSGLQHAGGGAGGGLSGSLRAALEYRATAHWSAGAWLDIDRSAYYAPTRFLAYLRYWAEPQPATPDFPPHPVLPISLY